MQICDIEFIKSTKPNANHPRTREKDLQQQGIDEPNDLSSKTFDCAGKPRPLNLTIAPEWVRLIASSDNDR